MNGRRNLVLPATFFEDALAALETDEPECVRYVATKARAMMERAARLDDKALAAEAAMIAALAAEKLETMPDAA